MYKCPCCGEHYFSEEDYFEVCPVCGWEDDGLQRDEPDLKGGANNMSQNQARAAGTKMTKIVVFAGAGTAKPLRAAGKLQRDFNVPAALWKKVRGDGFVDFEGKSRHCELHWYESPHTGRVQMKVKRWFDES